MNLLALAALALATSPHVTESTKTVRVSNAHYVAVITKLPEGLLTSLTTPDGRSTFLAGQTIYTDYGIYGPGRGYVGSREERAPHVAVKRLDGKVVVATTGYLMGKLAQGKKLIAYRVEYTFDSTPRIRIECEVVPPDSRPSVRAFLATYFHIPNMREWAVNTLDGVVREDRGEGRGRSYSAKLLPLDPQRPMAGFINTDGTSLLVSEIKWDTPVAPQNVIIHGTAFFFAWLDGRPSMLVPKPHRVRFVLTVGKGAPMRHP